MYAEAILKKGEGRTLKSGGAWVYDNEIDRVEGDYENGDILAVKDFDGFFLGWGFINTRSKITIRVMSRRKEHEITEEFLEGIVKTGKVCPHFHLSLQSGCDATLKRMNRKYTSGEYYDRCQILRKYFDHPALTTDVIVGFPGETEEEFEASYAFVDRVDFYETHIFKYSKREGTKAAVMDGQIDEKIKGERSARMIALGERKKKAYEDSFIGKEVEVLFEERAQIEGKAVMTGHTKEYMKIALETEKNISNCIVKVRIENHSQIIR